MSVIELKNSVTHRRLGDGSPDLVHCIPSSCGPFLELTFTIEVNPSWRPTIPGKMQPHVSLSSPTGHLKRLRVSYGRDSYRQLSEAIWFPHFNTLFVGKPPRRNSVEHRRIIILRDTNQASPILVKNNSIERPVSFGSSPSIHDILCLRCEHDPARRKASTDETSRNQHKHSESAYTGFKERLARLHLEVLSLAWIVLEIEATASNFLALWRPPDGSSKGKLGQDSSASQRRHPGGDLWRR